MQKVLKVLELTNENFKDFGKIITTEGRKADGGDENFTWYEKLGLFEGIDNVSINVLTAKKRELILSKLEYHKETPEAIIPMSGEKVIVVVAPSGELDENKMKAFQVNENEGIIINPGVKHFIPYPLNMDTNCLIIFKHATGTNDLIMENLLQSYEIKIYKE